MQLLDKKDTSLSIIILELHLLLELYLLLRLL